MLGALGLKLGMSKGRQLADALGVTRRLGTTRQDVAFGGDLVDTSAVMDRSFLVIGQAGLFGPELLIPEPVADEIATLAEGPDPVSSRRARRGLEALEELRSQGAQGHLRTGRRPRRGFDGGQGRHPRGPVACSSRDVLGGDDPAA